MPVEEDAHETLIRYGGGPHGLGDPNDKSLRVVEKEVLIPKIMRDVARAEKCASEVEEFTRCCKDSKLAMVYSCRDENDRLKNCLISWYQNEDFKNYCKEIYLKQRSEYRATGISKKKREAAEKLENKES